MRHSHAKLSWSCLRQLFTVGIDLNQLSRSTVECAHLLAARCMPNTLGTAASKRARATLSRLLSSREWRQRSPGWDNRSARLRFSDQPGDRGRIVIFSGRARSSEQDRERLQDARDLSFQDQCHTDAPAIQAVSVPPCREQSPPATQRRSSGSLERRALLRRGSIAQSPRSHGDPAMSATTRQQPRKACGFARLKPCCSRSPPSLHIGATCYRLRPQPDLIGRK